MGFPLVVRYNTGKPRSAEDIARTQIDTPAGACARTGMGGIVKDRANLPARPVGLGFYLRNS